jgi:hypothetical protein
VGTVFYALADVAAKEQGDAEKAALSATDGAGCGKLRHGACSTFIALDARRVALVDASTVSFIIATVLATATVGFVAYEKDRGSLAISAGGAVGRFVW